MTFKSKTPTAEEKGEKDLDPLNTPEELAKLPILVYGKRRKTVAKELRVSVVSLDKAVSEARAKMGIGKSLQGGEIVFLEIFPANEPVDGYALFSKIRAVLERYLILPPGAAVTIALWIIRTFAHDVFEINPRLAALSPEKQCGKTTLLELLSMIVPRPLFSSNCTPATIFRTIEKCQPTFLVDEMDSFQNSHEELRGILNSGHTRSAARVIRLVGNDYEPRIFSTWCPMALAAIGKLPDTLEDRSLRIDLQRKKKSDTVQQFPRKGHPLRALRAEMEELQGQCTRWVSDNYAQLSEAEPAVIYELSDRANDNWYSLLSIAEVINKECSQQAGIAALQLSKLSLEGDTIGVRLLADLKIIFESEEIEGMWSKDLCLALEQLEERPWSTYRKGFPLSTNQLARILRGFGISSQTIWKGKTCSAKGYLKENFLEAWDRYCAPCSENLDSHRQDDRTYINTGETSDFQSVSGADPDVSKNGTFAHPIEKFDDLTIQNQEFQGIDGKHLEDDREEILNLDD